MFPIGVPALQVGARRRSFLVEARSIDRAPTSSIAGSRRSRAPVQKDLRSPGNQATAKARREVVAIDANAEVKADVRSAELRP